MVKICSTLKVPDGGEVSPFFGFVQEESENSHTHNFSYKNEEILNIFIGEWDCRSLEMN